MTVEQLDAFGAALEESGYEKLFDNFIPGTPSGESYYGARDYYLDGISDGAFTRLAIEIYPVDDLTPPSGRRTSTTCRPRRDSCRRRR